MSVSAFLALLITREREAQRRRLLEADWAAYAKEGLDADYALAAQIEAAAESPLPFKTPARKRRGKA